MVLGLNIPNSSSRSRTVSGFRGLGFRPESAARRTAVSHFMSPHALGLEPHARFQRCCRFEGVAGGMTVPDRPIAVGRFGSGLSTVFG